MKTLGIALVILGVVMMAYTGFNYVTKEKVVDLGPIQIDKEKTHTVEWPPIIGLVMVIGGVIAIAATKKGS